MRALIVLALWVGASASWPAARALAAQSVGAEVVVHVRSAATGEPLPGAQVHLEATTIGGITDSRGILHLRSVPAGFHVVHARSVAYETASAEVELPAGEIRSVALSLKLRAVVLPEVAVRAQVSPGTRRLANVGYFQRRTLGVGQFIHRDQIEQRHPRMLSDMLRTVPGVRLTPTRHGDSYATMRRSSAAGRTCPIQYFLDGLPIGPGFNIDQVPARDVEALEIYSGVSDVPAEFNRRGAACGAIVIWTRID